MISKASMQNLNASDSENNVDLYIDNGIFQNKLLDEVIQKRKS